MNSQLLLEIGENPEGDEFRNLVSKKVWIIPFKTENKSFVIVCLFVSNGHAFVKRTKIMIEIT